MVALAPPREYVHAVSARRGAVVRPILPLRSDEAVLVRRVPDPVQLAHRRTLTAEPVGHRVGAGELERLEPGDRSVEADRHGTRTGFDDDHRLRTACLRADIGARDRPAPEGRGAHDRDEQGPQAAPAACHPVKCGVALTDAAAVVPTGSTVIATDTERGLPSGSRPETTRSCAPGVVAAGITTVVE